MQKIYDNTADKTNLDETYMTFCGCYLPFSVYLEYQQKYNVLDCIYCDSKQCISFT